MNIVKLLEKQAERFSEKPAIIFQDQPVTFRQLRDSSFKLANSLKNLGIKKGEKIAIYLPNWPEYIYSYLAIWCIGATAVPLDFMLTDEELLSCIDHSQAKMLIAKSKPNISFRALKDKCPGLKEIILCNEKKDGFICFEDLLGKAAGSFPAADIPDKDHACIFYTSGSTGRPKGVLCNYLQLGAPAKAMSYFVNLSEKDIALCGALPFSHLGGLVFIQCIVFLGASVVLMDRFIPLEFLKSIQSHRVNCLWLVPSMYYAILQLKEFESYDLSSLEWIVSFGAPSSADQLRRFHKYCPQAALINGWGMTETQGPSIVLPKGSNKVESVGLPAPWIKVKIFSAEGARLPDGQGSASGRDDSDREVPSGQIGEVVVNSWVVTDGYYKDPETTAMVKRNGWFHTGDLGRFDDEGYLYIVGRKKEMIKVAGEIVFEPEVESAIHKHPDIAEVAVIGVADKLRGEVPKAIVALREGKSLAEDELRQFCRQHLAHFKIPHYFEFRPALPKNRAGKIDKETLRKELPVK
jgi:acyl-CoA synthetase (AMP-forming)/AMP-acid ligase II